VITHLKIKQYFSQKRNLVFDLIVAIFIIVVSILYFRGIKSVPFHPDEATQIYASSDFETFFKNPQSLFWSITKTSDLRQHYRELDAPITRYLIGFGRWLSHTDGLESDWDWSKSWDLNASSGALPSEKLLTISRFSVAALFPFSILILYLCGIRLQGRITGTVAILLFASNSLILIHTRRAMAESALIFFLLLSIFFIFAFKKRTWLCAIPIALAFNSKQSATFIILGGLITVIWQSIKVKQKLLKLFMNVLLFFALFCGITFLLNPFLWSSPIQGITNAIQSRIALTKAQVSDILKVAPNVIMDTPRKRIAGLIGNLFILKPALQDIGNYSENIKSASLSYLQNPINSLFRTPVGGGAFFLLSVLGFVLGLIFILKKKDQNINLILFLVLTILAVIQFFMTMQIPFQRYTIIFVPIQVLWIGFFFSSIFEILSTNNKKTSE
jgi:4-amino-4-deoxy-L-arabinose transferase-like glycosyltransferase